MLHDKIHNLIDIANLLLLTVPLVQFLISIVSGWWRKSKGWYCCCYWLLHSILFKPSNWHELGKSSRKVFHTTWKWQNTTISVVPPPLLHLPTPKFECGVSSTFTIKPYWNHVIRTFVVLIIDVFLTYSDLRMLMRPGMCKFKF